MPGIPSRPSPSNFQLELHRPPSFTHKPGGEACCYLKGPAHCFMLRIATALHLKTLSSQNSGRPRTQTTEESLPGVTNSSSELWAGTSCGFHCGLLREKLQPSKGSLLLCWYIPIFILHNTETSPWCFMLLRYWCSTLCNSVFCDFVQAFVCMCVTTHIQAFL